MISIQQLIGFVRTDPVNLSLKIKLLAVLASFITILIVSWLTHHFTTNTTEPILVASMGASAVLLLISPNSPLSQPWPLLGGQLLSATIGITCSQFIPDIIWAAASAVSLSILVMLLSRCLHPPGAATALAPVLATVHLNYSFVLIPVAMNVLVMLFMAIILNRWLLGNSYPTLTQADTNKEKSKISDHDLKHALKNMDTFMDVSLEDLNQLLASVEKNSFQRFKGNICCGDIMVKNPPSVEYGTEVETAWQMMLNDKLKAMPVIDKSHRVIGIITWADFFKFINLNAYQNFQETFRAFIRRSTDVSTNKPESVGHIMTTSVTVLSETTHIVELIPLMSQRGIRQIPIVNTENRLVGMVYQTHLIAALYDEQLASIIKNKD